jgi:hypothetical protein
MSNPTTPFGWQMPQATDLVTDLPADFEVFGQAVATSMQDLLGGTTGQVLAKASDTDMDFVWSADAAGMTNPMTTTADVIYSSSGSTPARLGIGTANQVLAVNSGATAPEWQTISSGGMTLLSTTTLSGASTTISSIDQTYTDLQIIIFGYTNGSANGQPRMYPNNVTNNADRVGTERSGGTNSLVGGQNGSLYWGFQNGDRTSDENSGVCCIKNYASTTAYKPFYFSGGYKLTTSLGAYHYGGQIKTTSAIDELVFFADGGTFTSGTVLIYGVK